MNRFSDLYSHFEQSMPELLKQLPVKDWHTLVFSYKNGVYKVYENMNSTSKEVVEVNPAIQLTKNHEVWFFYGQRCLEAFVEYQPEYRQQIFVDSLELPLLQLRVKEKLPVIHGITH